MLEDAAGDPGTAFGAELAGWAYPATTPVLLTLIASIGNKRASDKVMPWVLPDPWKRKKNQATPDEVAAANAELEAGIVFS